MTDHFQRSQILLNQGRYDLAEKELRQALSLDPDYASAHALLAICLSEKGQHGEALQAIGKAIALSPDYAGFHYIYAGILREQRKLDAAKDAILEALRLDPEDADFYARLATIQYDQTKYTEALKSTEQGLSLDAEHVWSMNMRLLSLLELGRISEAEAEVNSTLAIAPEHPFPHTAKGWVLLHQNRVPEAMHSFREALRLQPDREWARLGLLESLKARNWLYRLILRVDLWRSRLTTGQKMALLALLIIPQTRVFLLLFLVLVGLSKPFFNFALWFDPYGRLALTAKEAENAQWSVAAILSFLAGILFSFMTHRLAWSFFCPSLLLLVYCIAQLRRSPSRLTLGKASMGLLLSSAILAVTLESLFSNFGPIKPLLMTLAGGIFALFLLAFLLLAFGGLLMGLVIPCIQLRPKLANAIASFLPDQPKQIFLEWIQPYATVVLTPQKRFFLELFLASVACITFGGPLFIATNNKLWLLMFPILFLCASLFEKIRQSLKR
jgi:tetratricopeptide (TPR) repeat protein